MSTPTLILIVKFQPAPSEEPEAFLRRRGYEMVTVPSGGEARQWMANQLPAIIVLDAQGTEETGLEFCRELCFDKRIAEIPVIFLAGAPNPELAVSAFRNGSSDFLALPFSMEELHARIQIHLRNCRQRSALVDKNRELERIQKQLTGMAQMATSVLHNVGNVVNSLNISADLATGHVQNLQLSSLSKLADMLAAHSGLPADAAWEEKLTRIPDYLRAVSEHYDSRRQASLKELTGLREKMDHVKSIISMQQNYARGSGNPESVRLSQLVENAIELNSGMLAENIVIEREFSQDRDIRVEKHRAVMILVNLIRNARQSCQAAGRTQGIIRVRLAGLDEGESAIHISDNGTGVANESLDKLFNFGFTTRSEGHGFGLNSSRKTAEELGGKLVLSGNSPGNGATFTLTLPHVPRAAELAFDI